MRCPRRGKLPLLLYNTTIIYDGVSTVLSERHASVTTGLHICIATYVVRLYVARAICSIIYHRLHDLAVERAVIRSNAPFIFGSSNIRAHPPYFRSSSTLLFAAHMCIALHHTLLSITLGINTGLNCTLWRQRKWKQVRVKWLVICLRRAYGLHVFTMQRMGKISLWNGTLPNRPPGPVHSRSI